MLWQIRTGFCKKKQSCMKLKLKKKAKRMVSFLCFRLNPISVYIFTFLLWNLFLNTQYVKTSFLTRFQTVDQLVLKWQRKHRKMKRSNWHPYHCTIFVFENRSYLGEFEAEFKKALARESGAQRVLFDEKTEGRKSRDTVPLTTISFNDNVPLIYC
jgi:hypothetical protein